MALRARSSLSCSAKGPHAGALLSSNGIGVDSREAAQKPLVSQFVKSATALVRQFLWWDRANHESAGRRNRA